jgi:hypothetical protein
MPSTSSPRAPTARADLFDAVRRTQCLSGTMGVVHLELV